MSTDNKKTNSQVVIAQCASLYKNYILQQTFHMFKRNFCLTSNLKIIFELSPISLSISMVELLVLSRVE